ncbi:MAG: radical SAM protein [Clostridia bacterium]|nr:radical SAM protein [Clostridia bacterium]
MKDYLIKCTMCPRKCKVNRYKEKGFCFTCDKIKVAHISMHKFEEPCISNKNGSGTVFFSGCNMRCVYCQNYKISENGYGKEITVEELANIFLKLQKMGADNINLVSPTIYALMIKEALVIAKNEGLKIPVIYNTNGFENVEVLKQLEDVVDVYLPDFKYYFDSLSKKYSLTNNYCKVALETVKECLRQKPQNIYDDSGKILKGVIIRHLFLPNHLINTRNVLKTLKDNFGNDITVSIMMQYFPTYKASDFKKINRKISMREYSKILGFLDEFNFFNGYVQEMPKNEESYVPNFDISTLK